MILFQYAWENKCTTNKGSQEEELCKKKETCQKRKEKKQREKGDR